MHAESLWFLGRGFILQRLSVILCRPLAPLHKPADWKSQFSLSAEQQLEVNGDSLALPGEISEEKTLGSTAKITNSLDGLITVSPGVKRTYGDGDYRSYTAEIALLTVIMPTKSLDWFHILPIPSKLLPWSKTYKQTITSFVGISVSNVSPIKCGSSKEGTTTNDHLSHVTFPHFVPIPTSWGNHILKRRKYRTEWDFHCWQPEGQLSLC